MSYSDPSAGDSEDYDWGNYYGGTGAKGGTTVNYFGGGTGAKGGMTMKYFGGGMGPRGSVYGPGDYSHQGNGQITVDLDKIFLKTNTEPNIKLVLSMIVLI